MLPKMLSELPMKILRYPAGDAVADECPVLILLPHVSQDALLRHAAEFAVASRKCVSIGASAGCVQHHAKIPASYPSAQRPPAWCCPLRSCTILFYA